MKTAAYGPMGSRPVAADSERRTVGCKSNWLSAFLAIPLAAGMALAESSNEDEQKCFETQVKPYAVSVSPGYVIKPILSAGERLPRTRDDSQQYQMVGIPDGLGAYRRGSQTILFMNHELTSPTTSEPIVGQPLLRGAFVSRLVLGPGACAISGDVAYSEVHDEETGLVLPVPAVGNTTRAFSRFCSGSLSWREAGFDRPIFFCGEEEGTAANTFDGKGSLTVAIFDRELHTLPWLGRFPWENTLVRSNPGRKTVVIGMEDGPSSPDSQLTMWVGEKSFDPGASALERNGLARNSGALYALVPDNSANANENTFTQGTIDAHWVVLNNVEAQTGAELETQLDAVGAFGFVRTEDGTFDKQNANIFYFVTTGGSGENQLGRLYRLELNREDPAGPCKLTIIHNADQIIAAGGDFAVSPDNIDTSRDYLMICEDGTSQSRPVMASKAREGSIWRVELKAGYPATRIVELNPPGTDTNPVPTPGTWETSGIISAADFYGQDSWLFDVQAHSPTTAPVAGTVEDGQLLLLQRAFPAPSR